jgi:hypothetical protein
MALSAPCRTSRFIGLLRLFMAALAILMIGILCGHGLSLNLGLMAVFAQFAGGLAFLPGMVAFQAIDLQGFGMLLVGKRHLPIGRTVFNHILGKNAADHQEGEQETCKDPNTDQPFSHYCFTPSLSKFNIIDGESLTNIHYLSRKKITRRPFVFLL